MDYLVYGDESRHTDATGYMTMGGVVFPADHLEDLDTAVRLWRGGGGRSELKWDHVKGKNLRRYKSFMETFFNLHKTRPIDFHCLMVDNATRDDEQFSSGSADEGFFKLYYQLIYHRFVKFYVRSEADSIRIYLDKRVIKYDLNELRNALNAALMRDLGWTHRPVKTVEPLDSHKSSFIQFADLLIGAVGYQINEEPKKDNPNRGKIGLSEYIRARSGLPTLTESTPVAHRRFTLWRFNYYKVGVP